MSFLDFFKEKASPFASSLFRSKTFLTIFGLVLFLLILSGIAMWDEWQTGKDVEESKTKNLLVDIKKDDIKAIHYFSDDPAKISDIKLIKSDNVWRIISPVDSVADEKVISGLMDTVREYKYEKEISDDRTKWSEYGLDPVKRSISFYFDSDVFEKKAEKKAKKIEVLIGEKSPVGYSVYSAVEHFDKKDVVGKVFIGTQYLLASTAKNLHDFRDKTLIQIDEKTVKSFSYESSPHKSSKTGERIEFSRSDGVYKMDIPSSFDADQREIINFFDKINQIKITEFVDQPDVKLKTALEKVFKLSHETKSDVMPIQYLLKWTTESGSSTSLAFTEYDKKFWASLDPNKVIFRVSDDLKSALAATVKDFRYRKIFTHSTSDIESVEIDGVLFKKVDGDWYTKDDAEKKKPGDAITSKNHVRALLVNLEFSKAEDMIKLSDERALNALPENPLKSAPTHTIKIEFSAINGKKQDPILIEIWPKKDDSQRFYIRRTGGTYLYEVNKLFISHLKEEEKKDPNLPVDVPPDIKEIEDTENLKDDGE